MAISLPAAGSSALISLDNIINLGSAGSISMWFYPTWASTDGVEHVLFDARNSGSNNFFNLNKFSDNKLYCGWFTGGVEYRIVVNSGSYTLTQNAWNHVLFTWDSGASNRNMYLNGSNIGGAGTAFSTWATNGRPMVLGAHDGGDHPANGRIAEFAIYNVELTTTNYEVQRLAKRLAPPCVKRGLQLYLPLIRSTKKIIDAYGISISTTATSVADHCPIIYRHGGFTVKSGSTPPPTARFIVGTRVIHPPQPTALF